MDQGIPVSQYVYSTPLVLQSNLREELDNMPKYRVVQPSTSLWASSSVVLVVKKVGGICLWVDSHRAKRSLKFNVYPIAFVEDIYKAIGPAKFISTLDLARGYWQPPILEVTR